MTPAEITYDADLRAERDELKDQLAHLRSRMAVLASNAEAMGAQIRALLREHE